MTLLLWALAIGAFLGMVATVIALVAIDLLIRRRHDLLTDAQVTAALAAFEGGE